MALVAALLLGTVACGSDEGDAPPPDRSQVGCDTTDFSVCGYAFDEITDELGRPAYTSPFSSALDRWDSEMMCQPQAVSQRGRCEDGRDFLYYRSGETAEVRFYNEEGRPTAVALLRAETTCGDPCPRESFYGPFEDLRCDNPEAGAICGGFVRIGNADMPFSQGVPLNACSECAP